MFRLGFVLEQTLGHVAHGMNLERAIHADTEVDAEVIRLDYSEPAGIQRLPGLNTWSWRASATARDELRDLLQRKKLDAIFIHTQVASLFATQIMRSVPTIVSLDATPRLFDVEGEAYGHMRSPAVVELVKHRFNVRALAAASRLVTWCRLAADSLVMDYGVPRSKIEVIAPGVDMDLFRPLAGRQDAGRIRVLFVGGQFERKGGTDLLEAARGLGDRMELDLVTADVPGRLPVGLTVRVHHGLRPQSPELIDLYRRAHIFVLPSRGDCMPQAVTEATACGLPVVATRVGAISEMVEDAVTGYLVPPRNPRALRDALAALLADGERRRAMG
ncbi:MAG TPA: glycosyltransferase family 4 protein, partial [Candidatus Dormibacteraeota bacterium]|nr:glycosyltransferase family 4 protein [Candidatus Dormibacteraeota bacterium]